jgi:hypothetical protein
MTNKPIPLSDHESSTLSVLRFELPSLRVSINLAEIVAEGQRNEVIRHPAMWFLLNKAPAAVAENLLLRTFEIVSHLDRGLKSVGLPGLYRGTGRDKGVADHVLDQALRLRHERVAHRLARIQDRDKVWKEVIAEHQSGWTFFRRVLTQIEVYFDKIAACTTLKDPPPRTSRYDYALFTAADLERLIAASETLVPPAN